MWRCLAPAVVAGIFFAAGVLLADSSKVAERIDRLIKQLGDDDFAKREAASEELAEIGEPALPALRKAAASTDAEVRRRAEQIMQMIAGRATKKELARLQGTWSLVSYETDGKQIKGEDKGHLFTFQGDRWSLRVGGQVFQAGTVQRIEAKEKCNAIDLLIGEGSNPGATALSIYVIEGDTLKYLNCGDPRPTEFVTKAGDGRHYLTFHRVKP
jgi:uncharacterized protein (TIGR03067 family)